MRSVLAILLVGGCHQSPPVAPCSLTCDGPGSCPDGLECRGAICQVPGTDCDPGAATSCIGHEATCGPTGSAPCCESLAVVGGMFYRSYDVASDNRYPDMGFPATVSDFRLDKYEVTVGRFRKFVLAGQGTQASPPPPDAGAHTKIADSGWDGSWNGSLPSDTAELENVLSCDSIYATWTSSPAGNENRPMNCVTWYEAMAFCAWDGGFLPTEAEWSYAATGGGQQRAYPWSSPPGLTDVNCSVANYLACPGDMAANVGSKSPAGDGAFGQSDLGGNVWEWVLDSFAFYPTPCGDCANLRSAQDRVMRGGSFNAEATNLRAGHRGVKPPLVRERYIGIRCARTT